MDKIFDEKNFTPLINKKMPPEQIEKNPFRTTFVNELIHKS